MAWASAQTITTVTTVSNSWTTIQSSVNLNPRELVVFQVAVDSQATGLTVTDALEVRILNSNDGGTTFDDTPVFAMSYEPATTSTERFSFNVSGYKTVRLQAQSAGATDDYNVGGSYLLDGVSA